MPVDLAQPSVLAAPAMIHCHRALCQCVNREFFGVDAAILEWRIPDRQRVQRFADAFAQVVGGLALAMALGGQLEAAQRLDIEVEDIGLWAVKYPQLHGPVLIDHVPRLVVAGGVGDVLHEEAAILDIAVQLLGVGRTAPVAWASLTLAPARQRADARLALVIG